MSATLPLPDCGRIARDSGAMPRVRDDLGSKAPDVGPYAGGARKVYAAARNPAAVTLSGVEPIRLDVTRPQEITAAVRERGDVNLLINNAGIALSNQFSRDEGLKAARAEIETNYLGTLAVSQAIPPV